MRTATILGVLVLLCLGCKSTKGKERIEQPPLVSREGQVGFEFVGDMEPSVPVLGAEEEYNAAYAVGSNPLPVYPEELLRHNLGRQEIVVRVIIDPEGRVARFEESPVPSNVEPTYRADFLRAIEEAVKSWQFSPASIRAFGPGPDDDGDGKADFTVLKNETPLTSYHDLRFFFEVKDGRGVVTSG